jgi:nicotinic acid mononucleotide adenylyltransferase
VALARAALEQLPIDQLTVLVEERPGHRKIVADADARLRMARAAFEGLGPIEVVPDPHPFTVDTVRGGRFGDALFIVGADQGGAFDRWKDPDEVLRWVKLAVGTRATRSQSSPSSTTGFGSSRWTRRRSRRRTFGRAWPRASQWATSCLPQLRS